MLTPTLARDLIYRIPKCQMDLLGKITWKCSDSEDHALTVFGTRNVKDEKLVPIADDNCKVSLKTMLMNEDVFQDALQLEVWSCFDPTYRTCVVHYDDTCKQCNKDKNGMYCTVIEAWAKLEELHKPKEADDYFLFSLAEIIGKILSPHDRGFTGLIFPDA